MYQDKKSKADKRKSLTEKDTSGAMAVVPKRAYVEDAPEGDDSQAMMVIDVPPRAPTPPPAPDNTAEMADNVNVFDFLVSDASPSASKRREERSHEQRMVEHPVHYGNGDYSRLSHHSHPNGSQYMDHGFSYGNTPVASSFSRYDSWHDLADSKHAHDLPANAYVTPAPKEHRKDGKERRKRVSIVESSEKKRKRLEVEDLDLSSTKRPLPHDLTMTDAPSDPVILHSGLTGGLNKLVTDTDFFEDRIDAGPTPVLSPAKRTRRSSDVGKAEHRKSTSAPYNTITVKPSDVTTSSHHRHDRKKHHDDNRGSTTADTHIRPRHARSPERSDSYESHRHRRTAARSPERNKHYDSRSDRQRADHHRAHHRNSVSSDDQPRRKSQRVLEYAPDRRSERPASVQPHATNQIVSYKSRAEVFLSFIEKGPESERGDSLNKVLKRYHRERHVRGDEKEEDNKELWKILRLRRNERGEIVLFM